MLQSDRNMSKVLIMANDHQQLLEATPIYENAKNVIQNHEACAVECNSKRLPSFTV